MMEKKEDAYMKSTMPRQKGGILIYIMIAIFLTGLLVAMMSQGAKKSATSGHVSETMMFLQTDIQTAQANIMECVISYQNNNFCPPGGCTNQYNDSGNPNPPFPLGNGGAVTAITCPRAPAAQQDIFSGSALQSLKVLQDTDNFTATYFTDATEGVYIRVTRTVADPAWVETIARLNEKYAACSVAYVAPGGTDPTGYTCTRGCLYYWILRRSTSSASWKAGCP